MKKEDLKIRPVEKEVSQEDLQNANGGVINCIDNYDADGSLLIDDL